jgi:antirestriction protein ArdC
MSETTQTALSKIEAGIESVRSSQRFRDYLAFCGRFHQYSFNNQLLIWCQKPNATLVAGFQAWRKVKRYVRKGEKGILILVPMTARRRQQDQSTEEEQAEACLYFKAAYVFDVNQTEGEALPSLVETLKGDDHAGRWRLLADIAASEGIGIDRGARAGESANGFYMRSERRIWVCPDLEPLHAAKTLAHELSHHFADHQGKGHGQEEAEMVAESSAYVVMAHLGCDTGEYSFGYLASWGDAALFRQRLQDIHETANAILTRLAAPAPELPEEQ